MSTDLFVTIPPGFDPEGLRVYHPTRGLIGVVTGPGGFAPSFAVHHPSGTGFDLCVTPAEARVSTADARSRDALARWVAERVGLEVGSAGPTWGFETTFSLRSRATGAFFTDDVRGRFADRLIHVPDLVALILPLEAEIQAYQLAPRLPDGSRWVDAAALASVVRHLASVAP